MSLLYSYAVCLNLQLLYNLYRLYLVIRPLTFFLDLISCLNKDVKYGHTCWTDEIRQFEWIFTLVLCCLHINMIISLTALCKCSLHNWLVYICIFTTMYINKFFSISFWRFQTFNVCLTSCWCSCFVLDSEPHKTVVLWCECHPTDFCTESLVVNVPDAIAFLYICLC